jgi:hypothetical protein
MKMLLSIKTAHGSGSGCFVFFLHFIDRLKKIDPEPLFD